MGGWEQLDELSSTSLDNEWLSWLRVYFERNLVFWSLIWEVRLLTYLFVCLHNLESLSIKYMTDTQNSYLPNEHQLPQSAPSWTTSWWGRFLLLLKYADLHLHLQVPLQIYQLFSKLGRFWRRQFPFIHSFLPSFSLLVKFSIQTSKTSDKFCNFIRLEIISLFPS